MKGNVAKPRKKKTQKKETGKPLDLASLRSRIDAIDDQFLSLLIERAQLAQEIGYAKATNGTPPHIPERERAILDRLVRKSAEPLDAASIESVFREVFSVCRALERPVSVAFLGPEGTYSHQATLKHFGSKPAGEPTHTIGEVFDAIERKRADYGVVPVENSTEGVVTHTLDLLVDSDLKIVSQIVLPIEHCLVGNGKRSEVKRLFSHPQALAQCRGWIQKHLPEVEIIESSSTTRAAELVLNAKKSAAIASSLAAERYRLKILEQGIQDNSINATRFLVLGRQCSPPTGRDRTSVMFNIVHEVGALHRALAPFRRYRINMTKIESRPSKRRAWEYFFFVDCDGHVEDSRVAKALDQLGRHCNFVKVLGSYPNAD